jgi:hypothetical protein
VVDNVEPARGFAAALALHVVGSRSRGRRCQLRCCTRTATWVGVLNGSGALRGPRRLSMYENILTRECGAAGRAKLAGDLRGLGFDIQAGTGCGGRYVEIAGVPEGRSGTYYPEG